MDNLNYVVIGEKNCNRTIWSFIWDQADGLSDHATLAECYIYFVHHVLSIFQTTLKTLQKTNLKATEVFDTMLKLNKSAVKT